MNNIIRQYCKMVFGTINFLKYYEEYPSLLNKIYWTFGIDRKEKF